MCSIELLLTSVIEALAIFIAHCHGNSQVLKVITVLHLVAILVAVFQAAVAPPQRGELFS